MSLSKRHPIFLLITLLILRALFLAWYIQQGWVGLGPDEAQYWTWSQLLDWGYYSKPAGIAWQIKLGCLVCGDTELGVRLLSIIMGGICLPLAVYGLIRTAGMVRMVAFWGGVITAFTPVGTLAALFAITDVGMVLLWTLACYPLLYALSTGKSCNYLLVGAAIGVGALFKWPIYILWIVIIVARYFLPALAGRMWSGTLLSLAGLIPSLIWNYQHGWVTFRHVEATVIGKHAAEQGTTALLHGNALDFIAAQVILLSPIFAVVLVLAWVHLWRWRQRERVVPLFSGTVTALLLGSFIVLAVFQKMQGNWCIFAYPLAFVTIAWYGCQRLPRGVKVLQWGLAVSMTIVILALATPLMPWPLHMHPFKHNLGWNRLASALTAAGYDPATDFLFADTYQTTSLLSFYSPKQHRAYFFNLQGVRRNQFELWPSMKEERLGQTGYFALVNTSQQPLSEEALAACEQQLQPYFSSVALVDTYSLVQQSSMAKRLYVFRCEGYNGYSPQPDVILH
jgi:4-amino-4-deoxy-L-arabinose transferase-like glycosyltransferase